MARNGPLRFAGKLLLVEVKRTRRRYASTAEFDPNRKSFVDDDATTRWSSRARAGEIFGLR